MSDQIISDPEQTPASLWWDKRGEVFDTERLYAAIKHRHASPQATKGLSTGWPLLDCFFTLRKRQVTVVSGVPNHGKSEFMDALITNSMVEHRWKWGIFSPENFPYEDHFEKIAEKLTERRFHELSAQDLDYVIAKAKNYLFWSYPKNPTLGAIAEIWKNLVVDCQVDAVLLDPWNTVEHRRPRDQSETEYIGEALSGWIDFARTMNVAVFIVAHPTKIPVNRETGMPYLMSGYDINGSANWVNKPDNVIIVQRPDFNTNYAHVHVQKVRDQRHTGRRGGVKFDYLADQGGKYVDLEVLR